MAVVFGKVVKVPVELTAFVCMYKVWYKNKSIEMISYTGYESVVYARVVWLLGWSIGSSAVGHVTKILYATTRVCLL